MQLYTFCVCHKVNICWIGKIKNISFFRKSIRNAITNVYTQMYGMKQHCDYLGLNPGVQAYMPDRLQ